jgi:hypothetical protein
MRQNRCLVGRYDSDLAETGIELLEVSRLAGKAGRKVGLSISYSTLPYLIARFLYESVLSRSCTAFPDLQRPV